MEMKKNILAFDIGGTFIKYGIVTEDGLVLSKHQEKTPAQEGGTAIVQLLKKIGESMITSFDNVIGIAISTAGQVDVEQGVIIYASDAIKDYRGTELKEELMAHFKLPVEVENDVNCAGLAEIWRGDAKEKASVFSLTLGTGIGGSYILNGVLQHGANYRAGEVGYLKIDGQKFEDLASPKALVDKVSARMNGEYLTGEEVFARAQAGNSICIEEIEKMMYYLAKGISTICYILNPEIITIGGGIARQATYLMPILDKFIRNELLEPFYQDTTIVFSQTNNEAGMIGAVYHLLSHLSEKE